MQAIDPNFKAVCVPHYKNQKVVELIKVKKHGEKSLQIEPVHEKTNDLGFRPGLI